MVAGTVMIATVDLIQKQLDELWEQNSIDDWAKVSLDPIIWVSRAMGAELDRAEQTIRQLRGQVQDLERSLAEAARDAEMVHRELQDTKHDFETFRTSQNGMMQELAGVTAERDRLRQLYRKAGK